MLKARNPRSYFEASRHKITSPPEGRGELAVYLHIPFCHARCGYCDFVTFTGKESQIDEYVEALCQEIELYSTDLTPLRGRKISTIFIGGGTPSVLETNQIHNIFKALHQYFKIAKGVEITLEANPESITAVKAKAWKEAGINRLSIGLQAYDDSLLQAMGRLHLVEDFCRAYRVVRDYGFSNVNVDLIYGFPPQTFDQWQRTVKSTMALQPDHLSIYPLQAEEGAPFGVQGMIVDGDVQAEMYEWARAYLASQGFEQYEISNFAKPGKPCNHNLIYWRQQDYLGLGVGAVGCVGGIRWQNHKTLTSYRKDIARGQLPRSSHEALDPSTQKFERLMLGLRLREGLAWEKENDPQWLMQRSRLASTGMLEEIRPGFWRIPDRYIPLTNQVLLPFV